MRCSARTLNRRNKVGFLVPLACLALAVVSAARADPAPIKSQPIENPRLVVPENLMEFSRLPLTYIQESIPFFGERNIFFFGRLEGDYAHYSSGIQEEDSGFERRRFRLGLAGKVKLWAK